MNGEKTWLSIYPDHIMREIEIPNIPLDQILKENSNKYPGNPAISFYSQTWTYNELESRVDSFASALQQAGVNKGNRVAIMLPNCPQFVVSYYGSLRAGATVVQVNPLLVGRELQHILADSGTETIVVLDKLYEHVKEAEKSTRLKNIVVVSLQDTQHDCSPNDTYDSFLQKSTGQVKPITIDPYEDVAVLQYTGGTTGRSKGAMLTHRNLVGNVVQFTEFLKGNLIEGQERYLTVLPLFHVYGMTVCMNWSIFIGACSIMLPRFEIEDVLNTIKRERPTVFPGVPTMYVGILSHPRAQDYGIDSIKLCFSGGVPMPLEPRVEFERRTGATVYEGYGLSESSPVTHFIPFFGQRKVGSIGIGLPSTDYKIVDIATGQQELPPETHGELIMKGPQIMKGYWNMPQETEDALRDGWLYTGDIAKVDEEGYVTIIDRKKDVIIASGYNVYPREVEEVLYEHPAVQEAAVFGVQDPYRGETVKAAIVLKEGKVTADEIIAFCKQNMATYKLPKIVEFLLQLPKSGAGKILRRELRDKSQGGN